MMHNSSGDASQKMLLLGRSSWNRVLSIILIHLPGEVASVWIQTTTDQAAPGGLKDFSVEKMTSGMLCTMYTALWTADILYGMWEYSTNNIAQINHTKTLLSQI